ESINGAARWLEGKTAVVTGAARGIGRAIAVALAQHGAAVVVNYRERARAAEGVVRIARAAGADAGAVRGDVAEEAAARKVVAAGAERWGKGDILVDNAGVAHYGLLLDTTVEQWDRLMGVHLRGAFNCTRAGLPAMIRNGYGRIINIA